MQMLSEGKLRNRKSEKKEYWKKAHLGQEKMYEVERIVGTRTRATTVRRMMLMIDGMMNMAGVILTTSSRHHHLSGVK